MQRTLRNLLTTVAFTLGCTALPGTSPAGIHYWDGTGTLWGPIPNPGTAAWSTSSSTATPNPAALPAANDLVTFNISTVNSPQTIDLFSNYSVLGLVFNNTGSTLIRPYSAGSNSITIGASGITIAPGAGPVTLSAHGVSTAVDQLWVNNSSNTFTLTSDLELSPSSFINRILTLGGSGDFNLNCWTNWNSTIVKNGTGNLSLSGSFDNVGLSVIANGGAVLLDKASVSTPGLGVEVHAIGSALTIAGAMVQVAGTGGDQIYHSATVDVQSGTFDTNGRFESFRNLKLSGAGIGGAGALVNNAAGTTATLEVRSGSITLTGDTTVGGAGDLVVFGVSSVSAGNYNLTKVGAGSVTLPSGNYKDVMVSAGTLYIPGAAFAAASGSVTIDAGARFRTGNINTARTFDVNGTLEIGQTLQLTGGQLINNGTVTGTVSINNGAIAKGTGAFDVVTVNDGGIFSPGNSPGPTSANALSFIDTAAAGMPTLSIEIAGTSPGTDYDQLHVTGPLALAGALDVSLIGGFSPAAGNTFDILNFGDLSGTFSSISLPALATGIMWNAAQLYTTGTLTVNIAGDYNGDGNPDAADYVVWRKGVGTIYTQDDFDTWRAHFGETIASSGAGAHDASSSVPEPTSFVFLLLAISLTMLRHPQK